MTNILNARMLAQRSQVEEIVKDLHQLAREIGHDDLTRTVGELRNRMGEPFMFVIVGEVKAGKSSFINALLDPERQFGKDICAVAPQPMTDTVQQILYGEQEEVVVINPFLKKVMLPLPILKDIAVVDTPGTNSIETQHQEITERFVPASDLVIFVFEAKNPYRQSAWNFFDYIHRDWHKKIIFVLQQKDLMSAEDLAINERGLYAFAEKKGLMHPQIFTISAKDELEGRYDRSNFSAIRDFIRTHVTGGRGGALKLKNNISTSFNILERLRADLDVRREQFRADTEFRADIRQTLDQQEKKSLHQAGVLSENILHGYDRITRQIGAELEAGLSFPAMLRRSVLSIFTKQTSIAEWLNELSQKLALQLDAELRNKLNDGVLDLADSVQQMAKMIDLKIRQSKTVVRPDSYIFEDIADKRTATLKSLQESFGRFLARSESFEDARLFPADASVSPNIAAGSGVAIVGLILAGVTNIAVLDITGGVLSAIGIVFAGITAGTQRKKIVAGYWEEILQGRSKMEAELDEKLKNYIRTIKNRIGDNFLELDAMLENEIQQIEKLEHKYQDILSRLQNIDSELASFFE